MANEIWQMSASDQAAAIKAGKISAVDAVTSSIQRMDAVNPNLNAVVVDLRDQAVKAARDADAKKARGEPLGPLHGVPVTIKVNVDFAGQATTNGIPKLKDNLAKEDHPVVRHWHNAGAITIGLTNTPEFSMRPVTENPLYGRTLNPWDPDITCGGSSGGAASSVAAGIGAIAHGNDIGGSVRWPAFACGVSTIKPTNGRVAHYSATATAASERPILSQIFATQGPIAREVRDVRLGLRTMIGRDPRDPWHTPVPFDGTPIAGPIKVAIAEMPAGFDVDPAVTSAVDDAARMLKDAGYVVERATTPDIARSLELWFDLIPAEMRELQLETYRSMASPTMNALVDDYISLSHVTDLKSFMALSAERTKHVRKWMLFLEEYPIVLSPLCLQTSHSPTADVDGENAAEKMFRSFVFQTGLNTLGLPGAVVPTGLHNDRPIGVQIIANRFREDLALNAAEAIEDRAGVLVKKLWARPAG